MNLVVLAALISGTQALAGTALNALLDDSDGAVLIEICSDCIDLEIEGNDGIAAWIDSSFEVITANTVTVYRDRRTLMGSPMNEPIEMTEFKGTVKELLQRAMQESGVNARSLPFMEQSEPITASFHKDANLRDVFIKIASEFDISILVAYSKWSDSSNVPKAERVYYDNGVRINPKYFIDYSKIVSRIGAARANSVEVEESSKQADGATDSVERDALEEGGGANSPSSKDEAAPTERNGIAIRFIALGGILFMALAITVFRSFRKRH